ncbi:MAG: hypothetical protein KDB29_06680, partial [Planctomycetes bacterium]|nr:hypothetical protein [Planctomycetota bacterium]
MSRIEDTFANRVILEYVGQSLTGIRSDTHRKVASIVPGDTDDFGNRVAINYDDNSLGRSVGLITTVSWGCDFVTVTNPRQAVRYEYSADAQLVAQSVADGYISQQGSVILAPTNRHGTQFNAYAYDQEQDSNSNPVGPALLKQVFSPSRAVLQNDPQDGNWKIVDQSQSGIQNLYVEYDGDDELRVVKQKLESGSERWVSITYPATTPTTTSRNVEWHSSVPSTTSKTVAYLLNNAGQPTSITINDHGSTCVYSYEYYDSQQPTLGSPQALKKVTFPKQNAITYEYGKAQDDPLARFESTKITQHAIPSSSLPPLETLRGVVSFKVQDRWVYFNTVTRDPWGNTSSVLHEYYKDPSKPSDSPLHRIISSRSLSSATSIANNDNHTATTVMVLDGYGRTTSETTSGGGLMPQLKRVYNYYVGSSWTSYEGFLKNTTISTRTSDSGPDDVELKTSYLYDDYGRLQKYTPPENANGEHATIYHHNSAGQVFRIEYPKAGGSGTGGTRANVWYYYDKDGRVEREISSLDSSLDSSTTVTTADGSEDDNDIPNKFLRPSSLKGAGWIHTTHIYNAFGEPVATKQDIDVGQQDVIVSSTAYDGYGRVISQEDATGRSVQYVHNDRDLVTKRIAAPGPFESVYAYSYDANGNVKTEGFVGDSEYSYTYDGHDRLDVTLSPAPGGWLAQQSGYPAPATTGGTKVTEDISGFVQSVQGQVTVSQQRIRWTEIDELGRPIRSAVLANDHLGQGLKDSVHVPFQTSLTGPLNVGISALQLDPYGNVHKSFSRMALPGGRVTGINKYNSAGWLLSSKSDDGHAAATYRYTKAGQPEHAGSPYFNGNQVLSGDTTYTYDPSGNLVVTQQEVGATSKSTTTYQLNDRGWAERVVDGSDRYSETEYNFVGWPRFSRVGQGSEFIQTETQYDSAGRVLVEKANRGTEVQETKYTYDPQGDLFSVDRPGTGLVEYYRDVAGRVWVEFRKQENVAIENVFDAAGNTVQRDVIDTPVFYSGMVFGPIREREKYSYSAFGETLTAETFKGVNEHTSKLEMKYNTLGLIEEQTLTVYQGGVPIDVSVDQPHSHTESELGFQSRYGNTHAAMVAWPMKATYDAEGRECTSTYWDDRAVKTSYEGQLLKKVQEYKPSENPTTTVEPTGMVLADYSYDEGHPIQRSHGNGTAFTFDQSPRGLLHAVTHLRSPNEHTFAGVKVRYDYSGNPAVEWRKHQGGLSRVMHYDHAGRLDESKRGHIPAPLPTNDEVNGYDTSSFQSHRKYTQDDVDNVTGYEDLLGATTKTAVTQTIGAASGNTIQSRTDAVGNFQYDSGNRISSDPTTKLKYEYNYRGQITSVSDGSKVLRTMAYDAFARMVLQVEVPGTNNERGTIFIPNIGFGGDGHGADTAGEVSYQFNGYHNDAIEVLQYSYGFGATGGGLGRKRTVEFVAYGGSDFKPYYRFLHEDTLGSTLATTDQFGDRHDEYDYTDYGVPLHAPVLLDGRHISSVAMHTSYPDVTKVNLSADILDTNELIGREIRVVKSNPTSPDDVYLTGTVISHMGTEVHIHDPGNAIFHAWTSCDQELTAVYDLHEGYLKGVIDTHEGTGEWKFQGWQYMQGTVLRGEPCTYLRVANGPFQNWMFTAKADVANPLRVTLTDGTHSTTAIVLGTDEYTPDNEAFHRLVVQGSLPSWVDTGVWYRLDGKRHKMNVAQSGKWKNATGGSSDTTFELHELSALTSNMVGWFLQPDINQQVYVPVTAVNPSAQTLTVSGDYSSMGQTNKHWRLFAPSGVETYTEAAGTLSHWASAVDSRCLYAGYRYEAPLAGIWDWNSQTADYRQGGLNFAGQHYTLYRHYDPMLMRFTSPDPIASPSYNLFAYSGNTPAGAYDPDGLRL